MLFDWFVPFTVGIIVGWLFGVEVGRRYQKWRFQDFLIKRRKNYISWQPPADAEICRLAHMNELKFLQDKITANNYD